MLPTSEKNNKHNNALRQKDSDLLRNLGSKYSRNPSTILIKVVSFGIEQKKCYV